MAVVVVRSYSSDFEAQMGQAILEANGISSIVLRDDAGGMLPSLNILVNVKLGVNQEDLDEAREILSGGE
ncbi:MAG: DUF2007 domain-containing protein [Gemmatimonadota bacterium]